MSKNFFDIPQTEINRIVERRYAKRSRRETAFRITSLGSIVVALTVLFLLLGSIFWQSKGALRQSEIKLRVPLTAEVLGIDISQDSDTIRSGNFGGALKAALRHRFPEVSKRKDKKQLYKLVSDNAAFELLHIVLENPALLGGEFEFWALASADLDSLLKGYPHNQLSDKQKQFVATLKANGQVRQIFNTRFFTSADSRNAEAAGIAGTLVGSAWMILVTISVAFPIGVMAALYLQEFAPKNKFTNFIEININTLASVPSIIFGLLGLAIFIEFFGFPRSAPLTGGLVLAIMTLPTIVIATRSSLQTVPPSIREGALALGASQFQVILHHVLPLSLPGILTGTIIGVSRAIGETAPLIMIGMVAFIVDLPSLATDPATALPVQIFIWADHPERAFLEKTALAILVLLALLTLINATAVLLRKKFTKKW